MNTSKEEPRELVPGGWPVRLLHLRLCGYALALMVGGIVLAGVFWHRMIVFAVSGCIFSALGGLLLGYLLLNASLAWRKDPDWQNEAAE